MAGWLVTKHGIPISKEELSKLGKSRFEQIWVDLGGWVTKHGIPSKEQLSKLSRFGWVGNN